jgi:hypothetical protein
MGYINKDGKIDLTSKTATEVEVKKIMDNSRSNLKKGKKKKLIQYNSAGNKISKYYSDGGKVITGRD